MTGARRKVERAGPGATALALVHHSDGGALVQMDKPLSNTKKKFEVNDDFWLVGRD